MNDERDIRNMSLLQFGLVMLVLAGTIGFGALFGNYDTVEGVVKLITIACLSVGSGALIASYLLNKLRK